MQQRAKTGPEDRKNAADTPKRASRKNPFSLTGAEAIKRVPTAEQADRELTEQRNASLQAQYDRVRRLGPIGAHIFNDERAAQLVIDARLHAFALLPIDPTPRDRYAVTRRVLKELVAHHKYKDALPIGLRDWHTVIWDHPSWKYYGSVSGGAAAAENVTEHGVQAGAGNHAIAAMAKRAASAASQAEGVVTGSLAEGRCEDPARLAGIPSQERAEEAMADLADLPEQSRNRIEFIREQAELDLGGSQPTEEKATGYVLKVS